MHIKRTHCYDVTSNHKWRIIDIGSVFLSILLMMTPGYAWTGQTEGNISFAFHMTLIQNVLKDNRVAEDTSYLIMDFRHADSTDPNVDFSREEKVLGSIEDRVREESFATEKKLPKKEGDIFYASLISAGFIELALTSMEKNRAIIVNRRKLQEYANETGVIIDIFEKPASSITVTVSGADIYAYYFEQPEAEAHKNVIGVIESFVKKHKLDIPNKSGKDHDIRITEGDHVDPVQISLAALDLESQNYDGKRVSVTGYFKADVTPVDEQFIGFLGSDETGSGSVMIPIGNISRFAEANTRIHSGQVIVVGTFDKFSGRLARITQIKPIVR